MSLGIFQSVGVWEILLLLLVLLLVFGPKRLPEMGRSLGRGMREFKDSITGHEVDLEKEHEETAAALAQPTTATAPQAPQAAPPAAATPQPAEPAPAPAAAPAPAQPAEPAPAPAAAPAPAPAEQDPPSAEQSS